jgi:hypothetical protein
MLYFFVQQGQLFFSPMRKALTNKEVIDKYINRVTKGITTTFKDEPT